MTVQLGDTFVLDFNNIDREIEFASFSLVTVVEVTSPAKLRVRADQLVVFPNGQRIIPREPFLVRRNQLRPYVESTCALSNLACPRRPTWKRATCTVECDEPHRIVLNVDGSTSLPDHLDEHAALSAISGRKSVCEFVEERIDECLRFGTGDGEIPGRIRGRVVQLSQWFACNALAELRFPGRPSTDTEIGIAEPLRSLCRDAAEKAVVAAKQAGRAMACVRGEASGIGRRYYAVLAVSDATGHARIRYSELAGSKAEQAMRSHPSTVASAAAGAYSNQGFWSFKQEEAHTAPALWSLVRLAEFEGADRGKTRLGLGFLALTRSQGARKAWKGTT